jgi:hypothetical protein
VCYNGLSLYGRYNGSDWQACVEDEHAWYLSERSCGMRPWGPVQSGKFTPSPLVQVGLASLAGREFCISVYCKKRSRDHSAMTTRPSFCSRLFVCVIKVDLAQIDVTLLFANQQLQTKHTASALPQSANYTYISYCFHNELLTKR